MSQDGHASTHTLEDIVRCMQKLSRILEMRQTEADRSKHQPVMDTLADPVLASIYPAGPILSAELIGQGNLELVDYPTISAYYSARIRTTHGR